MLSRLQIKQYIYAKFRQLGIDTVELTTVILVLELSHFNKFFIFT
jgi:hypothetical protein